MAAFARAARMGADAIETDLRLSRDGVLVAMHDATLDRTTDGRGRVHRLTLSAIRALDASARFRKLSVPPQAVPTLPEILAFLRNSNLQAFLEIKASARSGIARKLAASLTADDRQRLRVISFHRGVLRELGRLAPKLRLGWLTAARGTRCVAQAQKIGARVILPRGDRVTPELVRRAHEAGLQIAAWTINEPMRMRALIRAGVDGIITDYPDRAVQIVVKESFETKA